MEEPGELYSRQGLLDLENIIEAAQEPLVDIRHLPDLVDAVSPMESSVNGKHTLIGRVDKLFVDILDIVVLQKHQQSSASS